MAFQPNAFQNDVTGPVKGFQVTTTPPTTVTRVEYDWGYRRRGRR